MAFTDMQEPPKRISPSGGLGAWLSSTAFTPPASDDDELVLSIEEDEEGNLTFEFGDEDEDDVTPLDLPFNENLAEGLPESALNSIAFDLLEGIDADESSRSEWVQQYTSGMELLATKIEQPGSATEDGSVSKVRHPALLEACITFQARARGEILPASGPVKVRNDGDETEERSQRASDLQDDLNHYLTVTATEYYPDTDRALFMLSYGGTIYKKVYHCPLRERPASEAVEMPDLIVSQGATDLDNALRVTHRIVMNPHQVQDMQMSGAWLDIDLGMPTPQPSQTDQAEANQTGIASTPQRQEDDPYTIYECYTRLDLGKYGHTEKGAPEGKALPYRVTIEKDSQNILEIRRNWREGDKRFRVRQRFVAYMFIPAIGFLGLGFLHLLGNPVKALTALWRIAIDAGIFANFPGGVKLKGSRIDNNRLRPGPGEFPDVDAQTDDIRKAIMALPYKDPSTALLALIEAIEMRVKSLGGTAEIETGDGRTNVPVGTILAQIEQQTQVMTAVHKRIHQAQQQEFILLKELFAEDPAALWRGRKQPKRRWKTGEEFDDYELVPAADPNVPAQTHRIMKATALYTIGKGDPEFDQYALKRHVLQVLGIDDVDEYLIPPTPDDGGQDPMMMLLMAQTEGERQKAEARLQEVMMKVSAKEKETMAKLSAEQRKWSMEAMERAAERASKEKIAELNDETKRVGIAAEYGLELERIASENFRTVEEAYGASFGYQNGATNGGSTQGRP